MQKAENINIGKCLEELQEYINASVTFHNPAGYNTMADVRAAYRILYPDDD